jgi:hypothetical protein
MSRTGTGGAALACAVNAAWNALTYVYDPELQLDVVSLGLVYDVRGKDSAIVVEMTLAGPGSRAPGACRRRPGRWSARQWAAPWPSMCGWCGIRRGAPP